MCIKKSGLVKKGITREFRENIKEKRNSGKEYMTQQGKLVPARMLKRIVGLNVKKKLTSIYNKLYLMGIGP